MTIDPESHELEVEHEFAAAPDAVFGGFLAIHDAAGTPAGSTGPELDLRIGGEWTVERVSSAAQPLTETRTITQLDRPRRLAYAMIVSGGGPEEPVSTEVGLSFKSRSAGTLLTVNQRGFRSRTQAESFERSWPELLSRLAARVDG